MKNKLIATFIVCGAWAVVLLVASCRSINPSPEKVDLAATVTQTVVMNVVPPILNKNPGYETALLAVGAGVDAVFARGTFTIEDAKLYLDAISTRYPMDDDSKLLVGSALLDLYNLYRKTYGTSVADATDPRLKTMIIAFRDGILEGIKRYHAFKPKVAGIPSVSVPLTVSEAPAIEFVEAPPQPQPAYSRRGI